MDDATSSTSPDSSAAIACAIQAPESRDSGQKPWLGPLFAHSIAALDFELLAELLDPEIDFCAVTPERVWHAGTSEAVVSDAIRNWFSDGDTVDELIDLQTGVVADVERLGYRLGGRRQGRPYVVEQQAYLIERGGRIAWMRLACSGFRAPP